MNYSRTFKNLATHSGNRDAAKAAKDFCGTVRPETIYFFGKSGTGKTHLLTAIFNEFAKRGDTNIKYTTAEEFANDLFDALVKKETLEFRQAYRTRDLLIIDDLQFICGKQSVMQEFLNTLNAIFENGGAFIAAADRKPDELDLDEPLKNRLCSGLTVELRLPDADGKLAVIESIAKRLHVKISDIKDVAAKNDNPWEIEGAIKSCGAAKATKAFCRECARSSEQPRSR